MKIAHWLRGEERLGEIRRLSALKNNKAHGGRQAGISGDE
jgi:hypothetical protein